MNKLTHTILLTIIVITFSNCASNVKLKNAWQADNFDVIKGQKILVINKFEREGIKQRAEREIANKLRATGIDAKEAFIAFPSLKNRDDRTDEEIAQVIKMITDAGYSGIVITKLQDPSKAKSSSTRITENDTNEAAKYFDTSSYGKYPVSFGVYYNDPQGVVKMPNTTPGPSGTEETTENFSETFELETLTYNLAAKHEQLLGSISIEITDPDDIMGVLEKYAQLVAKQFE